MERSEERTDHDHPDKAPDERSQRIGAPNARRGEIQKDNHHGPTGAGRLYRT